MQNTFGNVYLSHFNIPSRQLPVACTRTTTPLEKATRIVINTTGKCQVITVKVVSHIFPDLLMGRSICGKLYSSEDHKVTLKPYPPQIEEGCGHIATMKIVAMAEC